VTQHSLIVTDRDLITRFVFWRKNHNRANQVNPWCTYFLKKLNACWPW